MVAGQKYKFKSKDHKPPNRLYSTDKLWEQNKPKHVLYETFKAYNYRHQVFNLHLSRNCTFKVGVRRRNGWIRSWLQQWTIATECLCFRRIDVEPIMLSASSSSPLWPLSSSLSSSSCSFGSISYSTAVNNTFTGKQFNHGVSRYTTAVNGYHFIVWHWPF